MTWNLMEETITYSDRLKMAKFAMTAKKFTNGDMVKKFECEWNEWLGSKYSLFVSSGSTANFLLVAAVIEKYNLKRGDKVLVPACTWVTNVGPIIQLGLEPIFCDINLENFSFDEKSLRYIKTIHPDIKMIFVTHLLGFYANNTLISSVFPDAIVIDDVCESHGVKDEHGSRVGSDSLGATFSFYFGHHMTSIEGGMVSTNDPDLYDLMKMKRSHGLARESVNYEQYSELYNDVAKSFLFVTDGYNFRNHELCAVLGSSQLKRLNGMIERRRNNYDMFKSLTNKNLDKFHKISDNASNSSFCFPIICRDEEIKKSLINKFDLNGIEYRPVVSGNLLKQPFLKGYDLVSDKAINNIDVVNNYGVYVGNNHFVTDKNIKLLEKIYEEM